MHGVHVGLLFGVGDHGNRDSGQRNRCHMTTVTKMTVDEYRKRFGVRHGSDRASSSKPRKPRVDHEGQEQAQLFLWAHARIEEDPIKWRDLDLMHCSLNGVKLTKGQAGKAKAQGMRAGIPDIFLPVPRGNWHGLYIEMKFGSNKPKGEQADVIERLDRLGYKMVVSWSWQAARDVITAYYDER